jgi:hypothetical protein
MAEQKGRPERPEFRAELKQSEIKVAQARSTGDEFVVFGRPILELIDVTGMEEKHKALMVPILEETNELEALIAAVQVAKGWDEYQPSSPE